MPSGTFPRLVSDTSKPNFSSVETASLTVYSWRVTADTPTTITCDYDLGPITPDQKLRASLIFNNTDWNALNAAQKLDVLRIAIRRLMREPD